MEVRTATIRDAAIIAEFNRALARETESIELDSATVLAGVRSGVADPARAVYFVAEFEREVVGCCMITHEWSDWRNGDMWWLQSVYVPPEHRRRGVFRAMYQHVESAARLAGAVCLRLYVEHENVRAKKVYESLGMHLTSYQVMERRLASGDSPDAQAGH